MGAPVARFARARPTYGQNLVALAQGLQRAGGGPLPVLDIGANVGDSASQIMAGTDARVLCVEADPYWAGYLRRNVGGDARATIVEVLLTAGEGGGAGARPVRRGGTTRFVEQAGAGDLPALSVAQLRDLHPAFDRCRLVKSDTDGFDTTLVPAMAEVWKDRPPVLFFEFDPGLARLAGDRDPNQLWEQLSVLGYRRLAIWDNAGDPLGQLDTPDAAAAAARLEPRPVDLGYHFWDVAAWHRDDGEAQARVPTSSWARPTASGASGRVEGVTRPAAASRRRAPPHQLPPHRTPPWPADRPAGRSWPG